MKHIKKFSENKPEIGDVYLYKDIRPQFLVSNPKYHTIKGLIHISWNDYQGSKKGEHYSLKYYSNDRVFIVMSDYRYDSYVVMVQSSKGAIQTRIIRDGQFENFVKIEDYYDDYPDNVINFYKDIKKRSVDYGSDYDGNRVIKEWFRKIPDIGFRLDADKYNL